LTTRPTSVASASARSIRGKVKTGQNVLVMFGTEEEAAEHERTPIKAKIGQVFGLQGPEQGRDG
jgi:hypothetical protein